MIRASRGIALLCADVALALHGAGLWVSEPREEIEIEGGAGAQEARPGSSFADMVAGTARPVSDSTVTPNRQSELVVEPTAPGAAPRSETQRAETPPPDEAAPPAPQEMAETPAAQEMAETPPAETAAPQATPLHAARARDPAPVVEPPEPSAAEPVRPTPAKSSDAPPEAAPPAESAGLPPREATQRAAPASREAIEARPEEEEGVQVSRRPQPRPPEIEAAAAARQSPDPERREARRRSRPGNNADRDAAAGSAAGRDTATAARHGDAASRDSGAQGNAAASNYPGGVMRHLARVPRARAASRGATLVRFSIGASGQLASVGLARSSGSSRLVRAALTVV